MNSIETIENRTIKRNALFLITLGLALGLLGITKDNTATTFAGFTFSVISILCLYLIIIDRQNIAKILWALLTPILLIVSPMFFKIREPSTIMSYGYLFVGGMLFCTYSLKLKKEQILVWLSIVLFFAGYFSYDTIIINKNFSNDPQIVFFVENAAYIKATRVFHFLTLIYFIRLLQKNRIKIENDLLERIEKLNKFTNNLIASSKSKLITSTDLIGSLEEILKNTSEALDVSRLSIWEYLPDDESIKLVVGYDSIHKSYNYEGQLLKSHYPQYFKLLLEEKTIVASDAVNDQATKEFFENYLVAHDIKSMLDTPFFIDGRFMGILCFEEQRQIRQWDDMEQLFSMSVGKLVSISYYWAEKRKHYIETLKLSKDLQSKNQTLNVVNTKMLQVNEELTSHLKGKEQNLQELKKFFEDMSFKNAHIVRAPLSRILALVKLYNLDENETNKQLYLTHLDQAATDLDRILKEISDLLNISHFK